MPTPRRTPTPPRVLQPKPTPIPSSGLPKPSLPPKRMTPVEKAVASLQVELDRMTAKLPGQLTRGQRARGGLPKAEAVAVIATGAKGQPKGFRRGQSFFLPVGTNPIIGKVFSKVPVPGYGRIPPRSTKISLLASTHVGGVRGVFRHETAHQLLRSQGVKQVGIPGGQESLVKKAALPQDVPMRQFFKLVEQVGKEALSPTKEEAKRTSRMRQQIRFGHRRVQVMKQKKAAEEAKRRLLSK